MLNSLPIHLRETLYLAVSLIVTVVGAAGLYVIFFRLLRSLFRKWDRDIALVTLNVSAYPALFLFVATCLKITGQRSEILGSVLWLQRLLLAGIIAALGYWSLCLFKQVIVYYLKDYAETTEMMWDQVLIPLLEGVIPTLLIVLSTAAIFQFSLGLDLSGIWLTLGGSAFVIGFAVKDILANFFSGIVLLLDSPFQFGDVLRIDGNQDGGELGILRKIGVRVTHIYMFETHTEVYIPNSVMQSQRITNLSRPIEPIHYSTRIQLRSHCDQEQARRIMEEILQAHPDTLGDIGTKLVHLERYFNWEETDKSFLNKKENGRQRLEAEHAVNEKLADIEQALEALSITLGFVEKGGLDPDDVETIQEEFNYVLELIGLKVVQQTPRPRRSFLGLQQRLIRFQLEETQDSDALISLVREWYRIWLRDPNVVHKDEYILSEIWERKIELLKKQAYKLNQKILHPYREETRLDDYSRKFVKWLRNRFKQARSAWQNPDVRLEQVVHDRERTFFEFSLEYYVDDIRLEDGERGDRINSDIHREILLHLKDACQVTA
ncbi:mechanosensitive ion channel family protein [Oscillatoria sp. CS-180]|uniref:mechanosensitive ion channel family protein n=1 Tax=Oscillatoria sp. CS-180 TaxID=3021720 RepID=UPI00232F1D02|nr:mechanosensitive ion channel family protein [Oscillatoria sp. CS-180]MDB9527514.1 mechanosensitive ion channel family protein [Oscillatoria sp. CS-180]